jgi:regulator of replication initiation timing
LTTEKKIKILEHYLEQLEEENADLKAENKRLNELLEKNDVNSVAELQNEFKKLILDVRKQKEKYEELNRDMVKLKKGYSNDMKRVLFRAKFG